MVLSAAMMCRYGLNLPKVCLLGGCFSRAAGAGCSCWCWCWLQLLVHAPGVGYHAAGLAPWAAAEGQGHLWLVIVVGAAWLHLNVQRPSRSSSAAPCFPSPLLRSTWKQLFLLERPAEHLPLRCVQPPYNSAAHQCTRRSALKKIQLQTGIGAVLGDVQLCRAVQVFSQATAALGSGSTQRFVGWAA
jgi:hypothetical protein